jgi:hypothetical protein
MPTREEIEQSRQEGMDARNAAKLEKAYSKSLTNTEYAPEKKDPRDAVRGQRGYAKGGSVGSASKRADGIATKGKTRGTIIAMCGGGMYKK